MDSNYKHPASPGTPLFQVSPERVNQQRHELNASPSNAVGRHLRESSVHEKVAKFDSLAFQGKALERRANDAALKRAMLGREEAESEMRRYRDEVRALRKQVDEGKDRERKVAERLESVMENYGRAKETYAHTQALWEKEIRRARKESFKSQSVVVRLQEELKAARNSLRASQADIEQEKERSMKREQEAFAARYQLVGVQEELANMIANVKLIEQERDALKTIAKNEEIARIAAEGQIPLPSSRHDDDEFASPGKAPKPLPAVLITSSAASEEELEQLRTELEWEKQRADRAQEHAEYMQLECQFRCCSCRAAESKGHSFAYTPGPLTESSLSSSSAVHESTNIQNENNEEDAHASPFRDPHHSPTVAENSHIPQQSTIFVPAEGVFRTVTPVPEESPWISPAKPVTLRPIPPFDHQNSKSSEPIPQAPPYARTPSCEPPTTAIIPEVNTSLLSLIEGPHSPSDSEDDVTSHGHELYESAQEYPDDQSSHDEAPIHTFHTISTTTRIPLASPPDLTPPTLLAAKDALNPTMSREEALAQIRERRGRARSLAQGILTPRKPNVEGPLERRDFSAPAVRSGAVRGRNGSRN